MWICSHDGNVVANSNKVIAAYIDIKNGANLKLNLEGGDTCIVYSNRNQAKVKEALERLCSALEESNEAVFSLWEKP